MFRRSIFWGLMLMLGASLAWMIISSRRREKQQMAMPHPIEIVQHSKPSATRIYTPNDLQILSVKMDAVSPEANTTAEAAHTIDIRNNGSVTYENLQVKISYFDQKGKLIESRDYLLKEPVPPKESVVYRNVMVDPLSGRAAKWSARLIYADLKSESAK